MILIQYFLLSTTLMIYQRSKVCSCDEMFVRGTIFCPDWVCVQCGTSSGIQIVHFEIMHTVQLFLLADKQIEPTCLYQLQGQRFSPGKRFKQHHNHTRRKSINRLSVFVFLLWRHNQPRPSLTNKTKWRPYSKRAGFLAFLRRRPDLGYVYLLKRHRFRHSGAL